MKRSVCSWVLVLCALIVACSDAREIEREPIGRIVDVQVIPTAFNQVRKTQVKTERMFLVVYDSPALPLGADAVIVSFDDGRCYLDCTGCTRLVRLWSY